MTTFAEYGFVVPKSGDPEKTHRLGRVLNRVLAGLLAVPVLPVTMSESVTQACEATHRVPEAVCIANQAFQNGVVDLVSRVVELPGLPLTPKNPVINPADRPIG